MVSIGGKGANLAVGCHYFPPGTRAAVTFLAAEHHYSLCSLYGLRHVKLFIKRIWMNEWWMSTKSHCLVRETCVNTEQHDPCHYTTVELMEVATWLWVWQFDSNTHFVMCAYNLVVLCITWAPASWTLFFWRAANCISIVLLNIIFLFFGKIKWWWWWHTNHYIAITDKHIDTRHELLTPQCQ